MGGIQGLPRYQEKNHFLHHDAVDKLLTSMFRAYIQNYFKYLIKPLEESFKIASRLSNIISPNFFQLNFINLLSLALLSSSLFTILLHFSVIYFRHNLFSKKGCLDTKTFFCKSLWECLKTKGQTLSANLGPLTVILGFAAQVVQHCRR